MKNIVVFIFFLVGSSFTQAQSSQLTVTTYPSCPDAAEGSASITPSLNLLQLYPDVEDWSIEYENMSTGEYQGPYLLFPPPSLPTLPILLQDLNPGTYEATLYLDRKYECRIDFDFFVDIAQGCACPELLADYSITHNCGTDNGLGIIELELNEFNPDRNIDVIWRPSYLRQGQLVQDELYSGQYSVTLIDDYGCSETHNDFYIETITPKGDYQQSSKITSSCQGSNQGAIEVNVMCGALGRWTIFVTKMVV